MKNIILNFLGKFFSGIFPILLIPLYFNKLGAQEYAFIGIFQSLSIFLGLAQFGLGSFHLRLGALFKGNEICKKEFFNLHFFSFIVVITSVLVLSLALLLFPYLLDELVSIDSTFEVTIFLLIFASSLRVVDNYTRSLFNGLEFFLEKNVILILFSVLRWLGGFYLIDLGGIHYFFIWQIALSFLHISLSELIIFLKNKLELNVASISELKNYFHKHRGFIFGLTFYSFISILSSQFDRLALPFILSLDVYGLYIALVPFALIFTTLFPVFINVLEPRLIISKSEKEFSKNLNKYSRLFFSIFIPVNIILIFNADFVLSLLRFDQTDLISLDISGLFRLLLILGLVETFIQIPHVILISKGYAGTISKINMVSFLLYILLFFLFFKAADIFILTSFIIIKALLSLFLLTYICIKKNILIISHRHVFDALFSSGLYLLISLVLHFIFTNNLILILSLSLLFYFLFVIFEYKNFIKTE